MEKGEFACGGPDFLSLLRPHEMLTSSSYRCAHSSKFLLFLLLGPADWKALEHMILHLLHEKNVRHFRHGP